MASHWSATGLIISGVAMASDHVDTVVEDQLARPGRRRVGARLDVTLDDLDGVGLLAEHDAVGDELADAAEDELVGLAETGQRAGERRGEADLHRAVATAAAETGGRPRRRRRTRRRRGVRRRARPHGVATRRQEAGEGGAAAEHEDASSSRQSWHVAVGAAPPVAGRRCSRSWWCPPLPVVRRSVSWIGTPKPRRSIVSHRRFREWPSMSSSLVVVRCAAQQPHRLVSVTRQGGLGQQPVLTGQGPGCHPRLATTSAGTARRRRANPRRSCADGCWGKRRRAPSMEGLVRCRPVVAQRASLVSRPGGRHRRALEDVQGGDDLASQARSPFSIA